MASFQCVSALCPFLEFLSTKKRRTDKRHAVPQKTQVVSGIGAP
jgi:hypothetical protein